MCILMVKSLVVFWNRFPLLQRFGVRTQNTTFFRKRGFGSSFYEIEVYVVTNWSIPLKKHQTIEILLRVDF